MNKMKPFKSVQRLMSMFLSVVMIFGMMPFTASAEVEPPLGQSNCTHVHGECSFVEGVACTHAHDETCGFTEAVACEDIHDETCGENGVDCTHTHDEACGFVAASDCTHVHDESCGFVEAVACDHVHDATCGGLVAEPAPLATPIVITAFDPSPYHNPSDTGTTYIVVDKNTAIADIPLPKTLAATAENGEENAYSVAVSEWTCATYDPQTPEVYVFAPSLALKVNESLKDGVTAPTVEVVVTANADIAPLSTCYNCGGLGYILFDDQRVVCETCFGNRYIDDIVNITVDGEAAYVTSVKCGVDTANNDMFQYGTGEYKVALPTNTYKIFVNDVNTGYTFNGTAAVTVPLFTVTFDANATGSATGAITAKYTDTGVAIANGDIVASGKSVTFSVATTLGDTIAWGGSASGSANTAVVVYNGINNQVTCALTEAAKITGATAIAVTAPVAGETPQSTIAIGTGYTGEITWNGSLTAGGKFAAGTTYTATIKLTADATYKFATGATITVDGATAVTGNTINTDTAANTLTSTATFSSTAAKAVTGVAVKAQPTKLIYTVGETLNLTGLEATVTYNDGTTADVGYASFGSFTPTITMIYTGGEVAAHGGILSNATHDGKTLTLTCNGQTAQTNALAVNKLTPANITWPTATGITYGQTLANSTLSGGVGAGTFAWTTDSTVPTVVNSGYQVTFTPTDSANWTIASSTRIVTVAVTPKDVSTLTIDPIADEYYDGTPRNPLPIVKDGSTTLIKDTDYYVAYSPSIDAGTATVTITCIGNYTGIKTTNFTINKADPEVTWPISATITYGQTLADAVFSGAVGTGTFAFTLATTKPTVLQSGTAYQVTFTPTDTANYKTLTQNVNITVAKATPANITWPTATGITYGAALSTSNLTGGSTTGTFAWTTPATIPNAGTGSYQVTFTPNDSANYNTVTQNVNITVAKATPASLTWPTASNITYGAALSTSNLAGGSTTGTFAWTNDSTVPTVTNSGYQVTFTPTDSANYNTVTQNVNITVAKATPASLTWPTATGITYGAALSTSNLAGGSTTGAFAWTTSSIVPTVTNSGYQVTFTPTDSANYDWTSVTTTQNVTITVAKATPTSITWPTATGITYGAALSTSNLAGGSTTGAFAWTTSSTVPTVTNSGYQVTFTPTDHNYDWTGVTVTQNVNITVAKATPAGLTWPMASNITYGAALSSSNLAGGSTTGTFAWTTGGVVPTVTNSGYQVTFTPTDSANYDWTGVTVRQDVNIVVAKASSLSVSTEPTMNAKASGVARTYTFVMDNIVLNKADTGAKSYDAIELADASSILSDIQVSGNTLTYEIADTAGVGNTATITITITTANYTDITATLTITVSAKDTQTIGFASATQIKTFGDTKFTTAATLSGTGGTGAITYASDNTSVATVNATTGEVTIIGAGSANITATKVADDDWFEATASYGLTVNKKTITVKADDKPVIVGDSLPTATVSYSGFVGTDSAINALSSQGVAQLNVVDTNTVGSSVIDFQTQAVPNSTIGANYTLNHVNGTLTVTAMPQRIISYNANGGSGTMASDTINDGAAYVIKANDFTRSGYTFTGWNTAASGGTAYVAGAAITNVTANMTLYAQWSDNSSGSGGGNNSGGGGSGSSGGGSSVPANSPTTKFVQQTTTSTTIQNAISNGKNPIININGANIGADLTGKDLLTAAAKDKSILVRNGGFTVTITPQMVTTWNVKDDSKVQIILTPSTTAINTTLSTKLTGINKLNDKLVKKIYDVTVSVNKIAVGKASTPMKVTIDVSALNLTESQKAKFTGVIYNADLKTYKQLGGKFSVEGNDFTFYTYSTGKYGAIVSDKLTKMQLTIGNKSYTVNGKTLKNDVSPIISNGRTMLPIRAIAEALGAEVIWDQKRQVVVIKKDGVTIEIPLNQPLPNGMGEAFLQNGRMYVPVRYIAEMLGANVVWDEKDKTVDIYQ